MCAIRRQDSSTGLHTPKNDGREKGFSDAGQTGYVAKLAMVRHCNANIARSPNF